MHTIYQVKNNSNNKIYIGCSDNAKKRLNEHINGLKRNIHDVSTMQSDFNTFGINQFTFSEVFCIIDKRWAEAIEDMFISDYNSTFHNFGYNKSTNKGWSLESRFRDSERKYLRSGKYCLLTSVNLKDPIAEILYSSFQNRYFKKP